MYTTVLQLQRLMTTNAVQHTFGFDGSDSVGKLAFAATQAAPAFACAFPRVLPFANSESAPPATAAAAGGADAPAAPPPGDLDDSAARNRQRKLLAKQEQRRKADAPAAFARCLIPCAIDQDPFFVLMRNNCCGPMKQPRPSLLHTTFLPGLRGPGEKMSSSGDPATVILLSDTDDAVRKKLRSAYSGGRATLDELRERGANLAVDTAFQYLRYFLRSDDELAAVAADYGAGRVSTAAVKDRAAQVVIEVLHEFRARRAAVTDEVVDAFAEVRMRRSGVAP